MQKHPSGDLNRKAGIGSRFLAFLLDSLLVGFVAGILVSVPIFALGFGSDSGAVFGLMAVLQLVSVALVVGYFFVFEAVYGYTLGKYVLGIVVTRDDGSPIGWSESIIRNILRIVDALPTLYLLGAILIFATDDEQRLGDIAANTVVVKRA
ncbi:MULTISPECIES: RDD family protein [Halomicrobium]|uniref:RDD domain containing protein n=2 Tax=Halomicrobium mukohataei TaxID=57705 RepID=C7P1T4_HALMD|nr:MULTISPECIES: RDD family protein [Halomicrobium]ACV49174.1 RDD domain containing protein [Halomicrobium mukohataei DSM 12286]QCD64581.1 RDD family protein [Halomicrobium mukohataei]QFR19388.1 RDD family protein [Halomicrobium sp. ZPS1]